MKLRQCNVFSSSLSLGRGSFLLRIWCVCWLCYIYRWSDSDGGTNTETKEGRVHAINAVQNIVQFGCIQKNILHKEGEKWSRSTYAMKRKHAHNCVHSRITYGMEGFQIHSYKSLVYMQVPSALDSEMTEFSFSINNYPSLFYPTHVFPSITKHKPNLCHSFSLPDVDG